MTEFKAKRATVTLKMDEKLTKFVRSYPKYFDEARDLALEAMAKRWVDGSREITSAEGHIDTGSYINSIGYAGHTPQKNGEPGFVGELINRKEKDGSEEHLMIGSGVDYAKKLEKRYSIMARALDANIDQMLQVGSTTIQTVLKNRTGG